MPTSNRVKRKYRPVQKPPTFLILAGIALLLIAVFALKDGNKPSTASALESQLDEALAANRPTFVFLHSLDCIPCKEMMSIVAFWLQKKWYPQAASAPGMVTAAQEVCPPEERTVGEVIKLKVAEIFSATFNFGLFQPFY